MMLVEHSGGVDDIWITHVDHSPGFRAGTPLGISGDVMSDNMQGYGKPIPIVREIRFWLSIRAKEFYRKLGLPDDVPRNHGPFLNSISAAFSRNKSHPLRRPTPLEEIMTIQTTANEKQRCSSELLLTNIR
jgi:hypothetical protein